MASTITATDIEPIQPTLTLVDSAATSTTSRNVVHEILEGAPVVTLREAAPRTGTLRLLFSDEEEALYARISHELPVVFTIVDTDRPGSMTFSYVTRPGGRIDLALDPQTANQWLLTVDYQVVVS